MRYEVTMTFKKDGCLGLWGSYKISSIRQNSGKEISSPITKKLYAGICKNTNVILRTGYSLQSTRVKDANDESIKINKNELVIIIDEVKSEGNEAMLKERKDGLLIKSFNETNYKVENIRTDSTQIVKRNDLTIIDKWFYIEAKDKYKGFVAANFIAKKD